MTMEIIAYSLIFVIVIGCIAYTIFRMHAKHLIIKEYYIKSQKVKADYKVCFVSDFHYMHRFSDSYYMKMIEKINDCKPDAVIFGGDYVHRQKNVNKVDAEKLIHFFTNVKAKEKIAVLGNHDKDNFDDEFWKKCFQNNKITLLINDLHAIQHNEIVMNGVDDYKRGSSIINDNIEESSFRILITHNPDFVEQIEQQNFDLILSGHLHGGQATVGFNKYPLLRVFKLSKYGIKYRYGIVNKKPLHIATSGIGAHFGLRFCVYPEIVSIRIENSEKLEEKYEEK